MDLNDGISNLSKDIADLKALAAKVLKSEHKVLFVDDESVMLKTYRRMFKDSDFSITTLLDPLKAVEALREEKYGMLVSDVRMPLYDGFWILDQIRGMSITKILITSMPIDEEIQEKANFYGSHVLSKDDLSHLANLISEEIR